MRKGQKACYVAFYKEIKIESAEHGEDERTSRLFARGDPLFNADQVDGLQEASISAPVEELPDVDGFIARRWTWIIHGGNRACLIPKLDEIHMPPAKRSPAPAARVSPTWDQVLGATPVRTTASRHPPSAPSFLSRAAGRMFSDPGIVCRYPATGADRHRNPASMAAISCSSWAIDERQLRPVVALRSTASRLRCILRSSSDWRSFRRA